LWARSARKIFKKWVFAFKIKSRLMQIKIYTIPLIGGESINEEMNLLLHSKKILHVEKQFLAMGDAKPPLLNFCTAGLPFLGYVLRPYHTRLGQISSRRFVKKYKQIEQKYQSGEWSEEQCQRHILPLLAVTHHADSFGFRKNIIYSYLSEQG
jgi:hypothetical protein